LPNPIFAIPSVHTITILPGYPWEAKINDERIAGPNAVYPSD